MTTKGVCYRLELFNRSALRPLNIEACIFLEPLHPKHLYLYRLPVNGILQSPMVGCASRFLAFLLRGFA